jgi:hypothetical protein
MTNYFLIVVFQNLPERLRGLALRLRRSRTGSQSQVDDPVLEITAFAPEAPRAGWNRKALIVLRPTAWSQAQIQFPNIKLFNFVGLSHTLVSVLNRSGYKVDIVDSRAPSLPRKDYDLVVAHGGGIGALIGELPESTFVVQYVAGLYWRTFERESRERYEHFQKSHEVPQELSHTRSNSGHEENMDRLIHRSDICFTADLPRMIEGFGEFQKKFVRTGLGAYLSSDLETDINLKDYEGGRTQFIYVGGTGGNIQKGLDIILQAFEKCPDAHLYIFCKVEADIQTFARGLLGLKNVHYVYHWRFPIFQKKLKKLLTRCNFTIHAPINTGAGTAFMGSLGSGMIPVGYIDLPPGFEPAILANDWHPAAIASTIERAMLKSARWCSEASRSSVDNYQKYASPKSFEEKFKALIEQAGNSSK